MGKEYIEREAACAEIDKGDLLVGNNAEWAKEAIRNTPAADVVEVVRCKDCKYYGTSECAMDTYAFDVVEEGFCSYGERKEG